MEVSWVPWWCQPLTTPGPTLTVPEVSPGATIACARVIPGVGFGSAPSASFRMSFSSDVTLVPPLHVVRAPALVLDMELRAALRDPVVHEASARCVAGLSRDGVMLIRALDAHFAPRARVREHRQAALVALERSVGLQLAQHVSDLHRCGPSSYP